MSVGLSLCPSFSYRVITLERRFECFQSDKIIGDYVNTYLLKSPLIFPPDLFLFLWGEIIHNIENPSDLLWSFVLYHVCHSLAGQIQQILDVQVVGSQDEIEE
eukprot:c7635_g2_i1 orf=2-307(-)